MKKSFFALIIAVAAMAFSACGSKSSDNTASTSTENVLSVDEIIASPESYLDSLITFEGVCSHACKHGATKIFVLGNGDNTLLRVEAGDLGSFDTKCVHNPVTVTGHLREDRIDEEYLANWAEQVKDGTAESHGDGEAGCATDNAARGVQATTVDSQIAEYRARIAKRDSLEGKPYLSFYYVEATSYEIDSQE